MAPRRNILSLLARVDPDIAENVRLEAVPGGFVNLTGLTVGDQVAALLSYGPRFLCPTDATIPGVLSEFGEIHVQIERHLGMGVTGPIFVELLDKYKEEKDKMFTLRQPSMLEVAIRQAIIETKEFFRLYTHVCVVQSDKGNRTCLMLLSDYQLKMDAYVQKCITKGVYRLTNVRRVNAAENLFRGLRKAILALPPPDGDAELARLCQHLRQFGDAHLPHLYGNVKCHKPDVPVRPICSTVAWYSRPIQKLLYYVLKSHFQSVLCRQNVSCTTKVAKDIINISPRAQYVFVKLDVTDMYGSMDKRRIVMLLDRLLDQIEVEGRSIFPKEIVTRMVQYSLKQSCLVGYQGNVYEQLAGLPQGACDSGFLATIFLDYVLQLHYEELFNSHRVVYWAKYMDDFLLYMPSRYIPSFKRTIERLTGLAFEIEPEEEVANGIYHDKGVIRSIPFLDLYIHTLRDGRYLVSNYRKPTASHRMIHALSSTIYTYKLNTVRGFLNNLFHRTSTEFLEHDLDTLYDRILMNGYGHNFIECIYYKAIVEEEQRVRQEEICLRGNEKITLSKKEAGIRACQVRIQLLRRYKRQFSLDQEHHYQTIREEYVATSKQPGYRFPYRSVSLSRLVFTACQYANMPPPIYCRTEDSDVFGQFLAHRRIKQAMAAVDEQISSGNGRASFSIGMIRCVTCSKIFIVSGRAKLNAIVEQELSRPNSEIYQHQLQLQHTVSPVVQVLRPVTGIDTAYLCQLYLAIYHTIGLSTSNRYTLSSLPTFVRTMLGILQGADVSNERTSQDEANACTWLTRAVPYLPQSGDVSPVDWSFDTDDTDEHISLSISKSSHAVEAEVETGLSKLPCISHSQPATVPDPPEPMLITESEQPPMVGIDEGVTQNLRMCATEPCVVSENINDGATSVFQEDERNGVRDTLDFVHTERQETSACAMLGDIPGQPILNNELNNMGLPESVSAGITQVVFITHLEDAPVTNQAEKTPIESYMVSATMHQDPGNGLSIGRTAHLPPTIMAEVEAAMELFVGSGDMTFGTFIREPSVVEESTAVSGAAVLEESLSVNRPTVFVEPTTINMGLAEVELHDFVGMELAEVELHDFSGAGLQEYMDMGLHDLAEVELPGFSFDRPTGASTPVNSGPPTSVHVFESQPVLSGSIILMPEHLQGQIMIEDMPQMCPSEPSITEAAVTEHPNVDESNLCNVDLPNVSIEPAQHFEILCSEDEETNLNYLRRPYQTQRSRSLSISFELPPGPRTPSVISLSSTEDISTLPSLPSNCGTRGHGQFLATTFVPITQLDTNAVDCFNISTTRPMIFPIPSSNLPVHGTPSVSICGSSSRFLPALRGESRLSDSSLPTEEFQGSALHGTNPSTSIRRFEVRVKRLSTHLLAGPSKKVRRPSLTTAE